MKDNSNKPIERKSAEYHKKEILKMLDELSDESIRRLYNLAEYLYIYKD